MAKKKEAVIEPKADEKADAKADEKAQVKRPDRLYRSRKDKVIAGVCGGIADYLNIDPVWVRLVAILALFAEGAGFLAYIIAWILIPEEPKGDAAKADAKAGGKADTDPVAAEKKVSRRGGNVLAGVVIVLLGLAFLMKQIFPVIGWNYIWPAGLIAMGIYLLVRK